MCLRNQRCLREKMENVNRKIETVQKNKIGTLDLKNKISKFFFLMLLYGLQSRLKKEEQVSELENKSIENNPIEEHRKKKRLKKLTVSATYGTFPQYKIPVILVPKREVMGRKQMINDV